MARHQACSWNCGRVTLFRHSGEEITCRITCRERLIFLEILEKAPRLAMRLTSSTQHTWIGNSYIFRGLAAHTLLSLRRSCDPITYQGDNLFSRAHWTKAQVHSTRRVLHVKATWRHKKVEECQGLGQRASLDHPMSTVLDATSQKNGNIATSTVRTEKLSMKNRKRSRCHLRGHGTPLSRRRQTNIHIQILSRIYPSPQLYLSSITKIPRQQSS